MPAIRVLLVDDHEIVRYGLRMLLESEDGFMPVGEASDGDEAVRLAESLRPDLVLMDVRMGATDGIEACRRVKSVHPDCGVIMLTSFATEDAVMAAILAGANGYLLKNTGRAELLRAIRAVASGQSLLDPAVTRGVTQRLIALAAASEPKELAELSHREREVLQLVAEGCTNRDIASRLVISEATARNHVSHILEKLDLSRRGEVTALAARLGLLNPR